MTKIKMTRADRVYQTIITGIIVLISLTAVFPLVYMLGNSFMGFTEWGRRGNMAFIPYEPTLEGYRKVMELGSAVWKALGVTIFRTVVGTAYSLTGTLISGYVISREKMPGRKF